VTGKDGKETFKYSFFSVNGNWLFDVGYDEFQLGEEYSWIKKDGKWGIVEITEAVPDVGIPDISGVILVLRAIVGLEELDAAQKVKFGIEGEPTIEHIIIMLRQIVGLE